MSLHSYIVCAIALCIAPPPMCSVQSDVWSRVPEEQRGILRIRFGQMVASQIAQDWPAHAALISPLYLQGETKEDFEARMAALSSRGESLQLKEFEPTDVRPADQGLGLSILGCGRYTAGGREYLWTSMAEAYLKDGEWLFMPVLPLGPLDAQPRPCKVPESTSAPPNYQLQRSARTHL